MTVTFPLFPDDATFSADNRSLMNNRQIFTRAPERTEEESLMRFANYSDLPSSSHNLPQSHRQRYNTVKRPLGSDIEPVNTYEKFYKKSVAEESRDRAKRALLDKPRRPKAYVHPMDRVKHTTLHAPINEKPAINEERIQEYQKRKAMNIVGKVNYDSPLENNERGGQDDIFNRQNSDYFKKKRDSLFGRGV